MFQEVIIFLLLNDKVFDAVFALNKSLRRRINPLVNGRGRLPTLEPLSFVLEASCLRPHSLYMLKVLLKVLKHILLLLFLLPREDLHLFVILNLRVFFGILFHKLLPFFQLLFMIQELFHFSELVVFSDSELFILPGNCHLFKLC